MKKDAWYNKIEKYIIIVMFIIMIAITAFNIFSRTIFKFTISWGEQLARLLLIWISFAGISWAGMLDIHMKVTAISLVTKNHIKIYDIIYAIGDLVAVLYGFYLSYQIGRVMMMTAQQHQVLSAMPWCPKWVMYLAGVLGMAGMSIRIIQRRVIALKHNKKEVK